MKKAVSISIILLLLESVLLGQNIGMPVDSITLLLCKKWQIDYVIMGGIKVSRIAGSPEINYEFNKDKTLFMTGDNPNDKTKGTWRYHLNKRIINVFVNGKNNLDVISLKQNELVMLANTNEPSEKNSMEIRLFYKVKAEQVMDIK